MPYDDEGPSPEDLERFSGSQTGYCPHCGQEIWDDVERCPHCHRWLSGGAERQSPDAQEFQRRMITVIIVVVIIAMLGFFGIVRLF